MSTKCLPLWLLPAVCVPLCTTQQLAVFPRAPNNQLSDARLPFCPNFYPSQDKLKDKLGVSSSKAGLLLELGRVDEAQALYRQLLDLNPDDYNVHEGLHR